MNSSFWKYKKYFCAMHSFLYITLTILSLAFTGSVFLLGIEGKEKYFKTIPGLKFINKISEDLCKLLKIGEQTNIKIFTTSK